MKRTLVAALVTLAACSHHGGAATAPDMAFVPAFAAHDKVDLLFVLANFTIVPKRQELVNRFPALIQALAAAAPASYHIGVITNDLGAGPFTLNVGQCHPGGDRAALQVGPAPSSPGGPAGCSSFQLAGGVRFIDYDRLAGTSNVVGVADVPTAFACMASLSDAGCPYFQSLEAAYVAVSNPPSENAGFLRDDALLVIVFLQDTDDCSAPDDSPVFDRSDPAEAGWFTPARCANKGIACGNPANPIDLSMAGGPFDDCVPRTQADGGDLYDVQRYLDFFTKPGGAKLDPSDVILGSIAPPVSPFAWTIDSNCGSGTPCPFLSQPCSPTILGGAAPAVRLDAVVPLLGSMCNTDYSAAVDNLAQQIIARLPGSS